MIRALLLAFFILLAGCNQNTNELPYDLRLMPSGLGAIKLDTPYDKIASKLVGFDCDKLYIVNHDMDEIIYELKRAKTKFAHIVYSSKLERIIEIHLLSNEIKTSKDLYIGKDIDNSAICVDELYYFSDEPMIFYKTEPKSGKILEIFYKEL